MIRIIAVYLCLLALPFWAKGETNFSEFKLQVDLPEVVLSGVETPINFEIKAPAGSPVKHDIYFNGKLLLSNPELNHPYTLNIPIEQEKNTVEFGPVKTVQSISIIPLWLALLPPLVAILLALLFKEVILALFLGILCGTSILFGYSPEDVGLLDGLLSIADTYLIQALADADHVAVIVFSLLIGAMVKVISDNGGMQAVVQRLSRYAKTSRAGQFITWLLGISVFFDDYANTLIIGNTMRPVTDRLRISREKLSYIVDSTAAPIAAIAFITTWIGAELGYIKDGIDKINAQFEPGIQDGSYNVFLNSLSYSFYPIFTLLFILMLVWMRRDFGPMLKAERQQRTIEHREEKAQTSGNVRGAYKAVIPILVLLGMSLYGIFHTGLLSVFEDLTSKGITLDSPSLGSVWAALDADLSFTGKLGKIVGSSDSYKALLWGSSISLLVALILSLGSMQVKDLMEKVTEGIQTTLGAIIILVLAWTLASLTDALHTADALQALIGENLAPWLIPTLTFVLAALTAFSTGSSWGTMAILYPVLLTLSWKVSIDAGLPADQALNIFYNTVACVLAGAVLGDHCSPISDTTILSSMATSCDHIAHVKTQLPYALTVGGTSIVFGILPVSLGFPIWLAFPLGIAALFVIIRFVGKPVEDYRL